ncbi:NUDIX hydrolase [Rhodococcoides corynebacterioides]|uniref:NUDIX hydrolase n=1 Tax=Rhodococcoides corynebacterioides TaxID=53972 RepID=UPI003F7DDEDE
MTDGPVPDTRLERDAIVARLAAFDARPLETGDHRRAAVALAVAGEPGARDLVLTRRPTRMRAHPGQFALPGGRLDDGESAEDAVLRELHEEIGVLVGHEAILGRLDDYATRSGYVITPFVVWIADVPGPLRPSPDEVDVLYRVGVDEIDVDAQFVTIPESPRPVVQWPFRTTRIHAPTGALVHQFREVVLHGRATRVADFEQPVFAWR